MEYKTYKLGTCFSLIENGAIIKQRKEAKGFPITRIETLSHGKFNRDKLGHADIFDTTPYKRYILEDKDLIMSHINSRAFLGRTVLYRKKGNEQIIHGMNVLRIKTNEQFLDPVFASYLFKTSHFKKAIDSIRKDAINQSSINIFDICNIQISLPSITEQRKISHALQLIDKKIETNHLINDNLEAMAKQLYDYWFVQFDFPNEEGKPYKSSGGAMVWNEKLKREIPQGWSGVSLKDLALTSRNAITPVENEVYQHFSIPSFDGCGSYSLDNGSDIKSDKFVLQKGQLLVSKLNPWFNRVVWVPKGTNMIGSTEFVVLNPNNESESGYIYSVIKSPKFIAYCSQAATGTSHSQRRVSPDVLMAFKVVYEQGVVQKYGCLIEKIQKQQAELLSEIAILTKQRDELLPLLMNGQATVNYHLSSTPTTAFGMINKASTGIIGTAKFDMD